MGCIKSNATRGNVESKDLLLLVPSKETGRSPHAWHVSLLVCTLYVQKHGSKPPVGGDLSIRMSERQLRAPRGASVPALISSLARTGSLKGYPSSGAPGHDLSLMRAVFSLLLSLPPLPPADRFQSPGVTLCGVLTLPAREIWPDSVNIY